MSQQPIETQVVLTTDNSQYDQSMQASASYTDQLGASVDTLSAKLGNISRSAGKKMIGVSAADIATITGLTAAYGAYERQMTSLNAQAAVLTKNWDQGQKLADSYAASVNKLRADFGTTTTGAVSLVQTISKMSDSTASVDKLANTFTKMSNATGESSTALASSVLQLQRTMGTSQKDTEKYANSLTVLAANSNTSATAIADFAKQIAPVGRLVGQSQADIQGIATAFVKAGQDGYRAGSAYTKVLSDIAYATQSGSPTLNTYANFVGMTVDSFKNLSGTEQFLAFLDQVNRKGPDAITTLNRMGFDGPALVKSIAAVTAQSGNVREEINRSRKAMHDPAIDRGNAQAMKTLSHNLAELRSELNMTAESMGSRFAPAAGKTIGLLTDLARAGRAVADSPLGGLGALAMGAVVPLGLLAGSLLKVAPLLTKLGGFALLARGAGTMGLREGFNGAPTVISGTVRENQGQVGRMIAANGSWLQRYQYNALNRLGAGGAYARDALQARGLFLGTPDREPMMQRLGAMGLNATAGAMNNFVTPMFSPMGLFNVEKGRVGGFGRFAGIPYPKFSAGGLFDPTARTRWVTDSRPPWQRFRDAFSERYTGRSAAPSPASRLIDPGVSLFDSDVRVTEEGRVTSSAAKEAVARQAVTREAGLMAAAFGNVSAAAGKMAASMVSAAAGTAYVGGRALGGIAGAIGRSGPGTGIGMMLGASALGINSNAITFGSTALMLGLKRYAPAAAGVGLAIDAYGQAHDYRGQVNAWQEALKSGTLDERLQANAAMIAKGNEIAGYGQAHQISNPLTKAFLGSSYYTPAQLYGQAKVGLGSLLTGHNEVADAENNARKAEAQNVSTAKALFNIGLQQGVPMGKVTFTSDGNGVDKASWAELSKVYEANKPTMDKLNLTIADLGKAVNSGLGSPEWMKLLDQLQRPDAYTGLQQRIGQLGQYGANFAYSAQVGNAIRQPDNMNAQYVAINQEYARLGGERGNVASIIRKMGNIQATAGDPNDPNYILAQGVQDMALREQSYQLPFMSRTRQFKTVASDFAAQRAVLSGDPQQQQKMQAAEDSFMQYANQQGQYFQSLLVQQREFTISQRRAETDFGVTRDRMEEQYNLSRDRAQADFNTSRKWQEEDFQLSRQRAEQDYGIAVERSMEAYQRSRKRAEYDFQLSRKRQEQDYQHQVLLMVQQNAKSMYDIYSRVPVEQTNSAGYLLFNGQDQVKRMQEQEANLKKLRKMGVSDDVIQQLGLTDPQHAQQLASFVSQVAADPKLVQEFNKQIRERLKAAAKLTKDESSAEWEEFRRQYRISRQRAADDFQRQVERSHQDFKIQMDQMNEDFHRSMNRQEQDYETTQDRQQEQFSKSMNRAAEDYGIAVNNMTDDFNKSMHRAQADINRMAREISGSLESLLEKATTKLGGTAGKQAQVILNALRGLDTDVTTKGIQLMTHAAAVFGFNYKAPGNHHYNSDDHVFTPHIGGGASTTQVQPNNGPVSWGGAAGGVLPAPRSVGSDNMRFYSREHGELNLAGGEAIMVPEWVDAVGGPAKVAEMNHAARAKKHFWMGGVLPLPGATAISRHESGYPSDIWAGDLNWPGRSDYGKPIVAYKTGIARPFDYGYDHSYGRGVMLQQKDGHDSLYAHMSAVVKGIAGKMVTAGQVIGYVGDYGNTGNPPTSHLHFELKAGGWNLPFVGNDGLTGAPGTVSTMDTAASAVMGMVLKDRYAKIEQQAAKVTAGGGMFPDGFWSKRINQWARKAIRRLAPTASTSGSAGSGPYAEFVPGHDLSRNQTIVRNAMLDQGWHQWPSLYQLVDHESGFNNTAQNPSTSAYGMFQFMDDTWAGVGGHKTSDPYLQALYGMRYIKNRYGDPKHAWDFWQAQSPHWYGKGGIFSGAQQIGVGEHGPEMVLPLNGTGANFLADLFAKTQVGIGAKATNVQQSHTPAGHTYNHYQIDRSTTFSGNITVQANNPEEMITKLRARRRVQAMAQASLGGVRG